MKTLALFSLILAVTLGMPTFAPGVEQTPVLSEPVQSPLLGDRVPLQGHVVEEDPAPPVRPGSGEQKEELAPAVPVDMKQSVVEEIKVKPQVREEQEGEVKTEIKKEPDVKAQPDVQEDLEADVKPEVNLNLEVKAEVNAGVKPEVETEPELNDDPEFKVKSEVEPDVGEQIQVQMDLEAEAETGQEIKERHIDMEGKYEMVGEPIMELEPLDDDTELSDVEKSVKAAFQNQYPVNQPLSEEKEGLMSEMENVLDEGPIMELEPLDDDNTELSDVEKSVKAAFQNQYPVNQALSEEKEGLMSEMENVLDEGPIMELEPLDDDNTELSDVEKSVRATFQNQYPVNQPLSEKKEGLMSEMDIVLEEGPIMELEPEEEQSFLHQHVMPDGTIMEDGPALDIIGQQMPSSSEYFPDEEAMHMEHGQLQEYLLTEGAGSELIGEEEQSSKGEDGPDGAAPIGVAPKREKRAFMRQGDQNPEETRSSQDKQGRSHCPGVILQGKCYQFFKEPKAVADAEFFCQVHFAGGHLASITSQHIHREVTGMMLRHNGAPTSSWIGGLRYLKTGRFMWLDGSHWSYANWMSGEPNSTLDVEDCVGVLARGDGKFHVFPCWERQSFVCSYTLTTE